ncbi:hypothetical protein D3C75_1205710 [compost metagenome]
MPRFLVIQSNHGDGVIGILIVEMVHFAAPVIVDNNHKLVSAAGGNQVLLADTGKVRFSDAEQWLSSLSLGRV